MSMINMTRLSGVLAVALLAAAAGVQPAVAVESGDGAVQAVWTPRELRFIYQGFTSRYSCDGLRDRVRDALLALGARPDLKVESTPCSRGPGAPDPFPGVSAKFNVPALAAASPDAAGSFPAHWKTVRLADTRDPLQAAGDCELLEQIRDHIIPLFTSRSVSLRANCVPHQLAPGGAALSAEVLVADPAKETSPSPASTG